MYCTGLSRLLVVPAPAGIQSIPRSGAVRGFHREQNRESILISLARGSTFVSSSTRLRCAGSSFAFKSAVPADSVAVMQRHSLGFVDRPAMARDRVEPRIMAGRGGLRQARSVGAR